MSTKPSAPRIPLAQADRIAEATRAALSPYCERIAIAGSVRRRRSFVGDIEIACIPRLIPTGLFGDELITDPDFCAMVNQWPAVRGKPDAKHTQRRLPDGILLDLFMADAENWGLIFAIRTGSADFSRHILATGWVKAGYHSDEGRLRARDGTIVPVREEHDLFTLLGIPWVDPEAREV
jgi:DNA polymerase/3'-5' exonuclease PolX